MSKTAQKQKSMSMPLKNSKSRVNLKTQIPQEKLTTKPLLFIALVIAVLILVLATQWPSLTAKVISFDDDQYLVYNSLVQRPGWPSTARFLTEVFKPSTVRGYYQPLNMISLMLDCAMGGSPDNLLPFHRTSLILHVLNVLLIMLIIYLLFKNIWVAAIVALFFGIHPLTVEPIPWIGERKTLLSTFFALTAIISYLVYTRKTRKSYLWAALVLFLLALLTKPTVIALPVLLLLLDYWPLNRLQLSIRNQKWQTLTEKIPFFILSFIFAFITYFSQKFAALVINPGVNSHILSIPLTICHNIVFYLAKFFWPSHLTSHYPIPQPLSLANPAILTGVIGSLILLALLAISLRWTKALATGWLFFFAAIFPTLGIIGFTNVIASDKYCYFPMLGFLLPLAQGVTVIINKIAGIKLQKPLLYTGGVVLVIIFFMEIAGTGAYLDKWQDSEVFSRYMVNLAPKEAGLHSLLGTVLASNQKFDDAINEYKQAIELEPNNAQYLNNLATAYCKKQDFKEAVPILKQAIQLDNNDVTAYSNLADALYFSNNFNEAIDTLKGLLKMKPRDESLYTRLGIILCRQGKVDEGLASFDQATRLNPNDETTYYHVGTTMASMGKWEEAVKMFQKALEINPTYYEASQALEYCHEKLGNKNPAGK